jgi:hypothetical protein
VDSDKALWSALSLALVRKNKINKNVDITFIDTFWNNLPSVRSKSKDWNLNFSHISFGRLGAINYKTK